jgi:hypothetical protein
MADQPLASPDPSSHLRGPSVEVKVYGDTFVQCVACGNVCDKLETVGYQMTVAVDAPNPDALTNVRFPLDSWPDCVSRVWINDNFRGLKYVECGACLRSRIDEDRANEVFNRGGGGGGSIRGSPGGGDGGPTRGSPPRLNTSLARSSSILLLKQAPHSTYLSPRKLSLIQTRDTQSGQESNGNRTFVRASGLGASTATVI